MKLSSYIYETLQKPDENMEKPEALDGRIDQAESMIKSIFLIGSGVIAIITVLVFLCNEDFPENITILNIVKYFGISCISIGLLYTLTILRGYFFKWLFGYKESMMNDYYYLLKKKIDEYGATIKDIDCTLVLAPRTGNGMLIGVLESFLYAFAIIIHSYALLGFILAVRSYVSVSSHPNKEESEFYIIGQLGSLAYVVVFTILFIASLRVICNFDIVDAATQYLSLVTE